MQTHDRLALLPAGPPGSSPPSCVTLSATIPGDHVSIEWDLMYHVEVVDILGNATFFPGLAAGTPYIVVPVERGPEAAVAAGGLGS